MVRKSGWGRSGENEEFYWKGEKEMVREGGARPRVFSQLWKRGGACEGHLDADESQQRTGTFQGIATRLFSATGYRCHLTLCEAHRILLLDLSPSKMYRECSGKLSQHQMCSFWFTGETSTSAPCPRLETPFCTVYTTSGICQKNRFSQTNMDVMPSQYENRLPWDWSG